MPMYTYLGFSIGNKFIAYCALRETSISKIGILHIRNKNVQNDIASTCLLLKEKLFDSNFLVGIELKHRRSNDMNNTVESCRISTMLECQANQTFNSNAVNIDEIEIRKSIGHIYNTKITSRQNLHDFVISNIPNFPKMDENHFNQGLTSAWATSHYLRSDQKRQELMKDPKLIEKLTDRLERDRIVASIRKSIDVTTDEKIIEDLNRVIETRREKLMSKAISKLAF